MDGNEDGDEAEHMTPRVSMEVMAKMVLARVLIHGATARLKHR